MPTLETSVRGVTDGRVTVDVLPIAQHSGAFGGPLPDAVTALSRMIATLHDDDGNVTLAGLRTFEWTGTQVSEGDFREESRVFDSVRLFGTGTIADRTLSKPAVNVLAFDAPPRRRLLQPDRADGERRASPPTRPRRRRVAARDALVAHLRAAAPWGVRVSVRPGTPGTAIWWTPAPRLAACHGALGEAFEADVVEIGSGGSIPLVPMLADTFPGIAVLIIGDGDDLSNYHSMDESVDLGDLERLALAEALLIRDLGG